MKVMKKILSISVICIFICSALITGCKKDEKVPEPAYVLKKWAKSIEELNYRKYSECEAYPKDVSVFKDMYKDYYVIDIMAVDIDDPDEDDVKKDYKNDPYIHRSVLFEGTAVKRDTKKPYQLIRGDTVFIKFLDGERKGDGWLMSNRTITRVNK